MVVGPSVFNNYFPRIPPILQFLGADPGDVITMKIVTKVPANGRVVSFHVNFQNAGIAK
jgi:DNA-directed RNA polymerase subunit H (RpoH/RPB5)